MADVQHAGDDSQMKWSRLRDIVAEKSFSQGGQHTLASGRESQFYFDMKRTMADPEGLTLIAELMFNAASELGNYDAIGGLEMGAVPIVNAVAIHSYQVGHPLPSIWIRKQSKGHGTKARVEGIDADQLTGKSVLMVEDVTTTGGSAMSAIEVLKECGAEIDTVITIVDRQEGAGENLEKAGLRLVSLFSRDDFVADAAG